MRDRLLARERNGDASPERLAPDRDASRVALRREPIRGARILDQPLLARRAGRAAVAAIAQRHEPDTARDDFAKAVDAQIERAAVAMEVEHHRLFLFRARAAARAGA